MTIRVVRRTGPRPLSLAVLQSDGALGSPAARLAWLEAQLEDLVSRDERPDLVLTPELFAHGYNAGAAFKDLAEPADGPLSAAVTVLARKSGAAILYGFAERAQGRLYNSVQAVDAAGERLTLVRKRVLPPGPERDLFAPGGGGPLFTLNGLTIATLICYEAEFPEAVRLAARAGAQLVLVPTALSADWPVVARKLIPTRAFENGVYVAYANHAGAERGLRYLGESCIVGPDGEDVARAGEAPTALAATIAPHAVAAAQARLPYLRDLAGLGPEDGPGS
ncbi:MAG: carbon-nitrogen hydrolase family protein [Marivibrio sp.]|uniref:carbon-nitrogen hydrolase family protein n=1 Tax=Marivibrio sp. TaxID=2039719 RepID=UPI0032F01A73